MDAFARSLLSITSTLLRIYCRKMARADGAYPSHHRLKVVASGTVSRGLVAPATFGQYIGFRPCLWGFATDIDISSLVCDGAHGTSPTRGDDFPFHPVSRIGTCHQPPLSVSAHSLWMRPGWLKIVGRWRLHRIDSAPPTVKHVRCA